MALECAARTLAALAPAIASAPQGGDTLAELFDVTACYFPITFTPPPNDPHGITQGQLSAALLSVFTATPLIVVQVVPLLFEKLASSMSSAKSEAIAGLQVGGCDAPLWCVGCVCGCGDVWWVVVCGVVVCDGWWVVSVGWV